jgi:hypothetical protein
LTNVTKKQFSHTIKSAAPVKRIVNMAMACTQVNLYEAKTQLSGLVDRAAKGEEIIIAKARKPFARLA